MRKRVFVGLSGGVDSALSAALLFERGYDVTGVFIKIWRPEFIECTWKEDRIDAMRVCAALSIPYREIDLSDQYRKEVVDTMIAEYASGITPNPDVLCNRAIKFGAFAEWAFRFGADAVATGHYARVAEHSGAFHLLRGIDPEKDQSYFLHQLGQKDLSRAIFPVGGMKKSEVRAQAFARNLPVAQKHDSQGLCFVGDVSMRDFLRRFIRVEPGPVVNMRGKVVGEHDGAALYTLGERRGFRVDASSSTTEPRYVVAINTRQNTLTVSTNPTDAERAAATIGALHWVHTPLAAGESADAQSRYRQRALPIQVKHESADGTQLTIESDEPRLFPPGQSLVFYRSDECLGGGTILKPRDNRAFPPSLSVAIA
jgi:tRNA-specific 2-thiouridylase